MPRASGVPMGARRFTGRQPLRRGVAPCMRVGSDTGDGDGARSAMLAESRLTGRFWGRD